MYGKPWRKSTRLIRFNLDLSPLESYRCIGAKRVLCKRTGKPHQVLSGSLHGTFWTLIAQPCPRKFCNVVARCYYNARVAQRATALTRLLR
eukprot:14164508-Heterocapsa_arctica.AAC.1